MTDFSNPSNSQTHTAYTTAIKDSVESLAKMGEGMTDSNLYTNHKYWNPTNKRFEKWNGSSWEVLTDKLMMDVDTVDGSHASDFAPSSHVGTNGAAHSVATISTNGFMSASDKIKLDDATDESTASKLMIRDGNGAVKVLMTGSNPDAFDNDEVVNAGNLRSTFSTALSTANRIMKRNANSVSQVKMHPTPASRQDDDCTNIKYVNDQSDALDTVIKNFAVFNEKENPGIDGDGFTLNTWTKRKLNSTQTNTITGVSLASNQITLPAGTFKIDAWAIGAGVNNHKTKLRNVTDSTDPIIGFATIASSGGNPTVSELHGVITIASSKVFEFQHICNFTNATNGMGVAAGQSTDEIYATIIIQKVDSGISNLQ